MSTPATVAGVYASALYELAQEQSLGQQVMTEVAALQAVCRDSEVLQVLQNGGLSRARSLAMVQELFAQQLSPLLVNFLSMLTERGRIGALSAILDQVLLLDEQQRGVVRVTATTALAADETVRNRLSASLQKVVGAGVVVDWQTDDQLVAGMCLRYGDTLIDGSARRRLDDAKQCILTAPLADVELQEGDVA